MININKIMMLFIDLLTGVASVAKSEYIILNLGEDKMFGIIVIVIIGFIFAVLPDSKGES